jgi:SAM-dependent methyltransferase
MYTAVADAPLSHFHFPVGGEACRVLGYPIEQVRVLPEAVRQSFAGVGYPFNAEAVRTGDTVLDIGAGAGNDSVIASRLTGPEGHVIALDLTPAMTRKLKAACAQERLENISVVQGSAERLPLANGSVDSITSNGALNLVPDKRRAVGEMFRVLRPGGRVQLADVVIRRPVTVDCREDPRLWVECVVGATVDEDLLILFRDAGFEDVQVVRELDYFSHSPSAQTREVAAGFDARSMEIGMCRGAREPSRLEQWLKRLNPLRWLRSLWRHGFLGMASLIVAAVVCYGTLAALAVLGAAGIGLALNEGLWAGAIAVFAVLAALAISAGARLHRSPAPPVLAGAGAGVVLYAMFVHYSVWVELAGFILLAAAVVWDLRLRRAAQKRILGLEARGSR